jgi:hypothetical protein
MQHKAIPTAAQRFIIYHGSEAAGTSHLTRTPGTVTIRTVGPAVNALNSKLSMEQDPAAEKQPDDAGQPAAKKPYVKPAFEFERAFETMALSCGKINTTQAQCKFNRKSS